MRQSLLAHCFFRLSPGCHPVVRVCIGHRVLDVAVTDELSQEAMSMLPIRGQSHFDQRRNFYK